MVNRRQVGPANSEIGAALREIIRGADLFQEDVARAAGIPTRTFARYLAGDSTMPASALLATATGMGIEYRDLADLLASALSQSVSQSVRQTDRQTDRQTAPRRNRRHQPGQDQPSLPARLSDTVTHSDATDSGIPSPEDLDELAKRAAAEIAESIRVKRGRRSGS